MEIHTTLSGENYRDYVRLWHQSYKSGLKMGWDPSVPGAKKAMIRLIYFSVYLLGFYIIAQCINWYSGDIQMLRHATYLPFALMIVFGCVSGELLKYAVFWIRTRRMFRNRDKLRLTVDESGITYYQGEDRGFWTWQEINPPICLKHTIVLSRGESVRFRDTREKVLLLRSADVSEAQRRWLLDATSEARRTKLGGLYFGDLLLYIAAIAVMVGYMAFFVEKEDVQLQVYHTLDSHIYQEGRFFDSIAEAEVEVEAAGDSAEELVEIAVAKVLTVSEEFSIGAYEKLTCDEIKVFYEDEKRVIAQVRITGKPWSLGEVNYDVYFPELNEDGYGHLQTLIYLEKEGTDCWVIREMGSELTVKY